MRPPGSRPKVCFALSGFVSITNGKPSAIIWRESAARKRSMLGRRQACAERFTLAQFAKMYRSVNWCWCGGAQREFLVGSATVTPQQSPPAILEGRGDRPDTLLVLFCEVHAAI